MKRILLLCLLAALPLMGYGQHMGIKTNLLHDATTTMNLGLEFRLAKHSTFDLGVSYNPWKFSDNKQWKMWLVQPEYRYWLCESFDGHFFGLHLHGGQFNINHKKAPFGLWPELRDKNYQGDFYGAGISWGYHWILSDRWGIEFTVGAGYARVCYDKYDCVECSNTHEKGFKNYWGPTKIGISLVFNIF